MVFKKSSKKAALFLSVSLLALSSSTPAKAHVVKGCSFLIASGFSVACSVAWIGIFARSISPEMISFGPVGSERLGRKITFEGGRLEGLLFGIFFGVASVICLKHGLRHLFGSKKSRTQKSAGEVQVVSSEQTG